MALKDVAEIHRSPAESVFQNQSAATVNCVLHTRPTPERFRALSDPGTPSPNLPNTIQNLDVIPLPDALSVETPEGIEIIGDQGIFGPRGGTKTFTWEVMPELFWDAHLALERHWSSRVVNAHVKLNTMQHVATAMTYDSITEAMVERLDESSNCDRYHPHVQR
ncbi:hypothetical protein QFC21_006793 [Naganishia friedmannii]|uniref:Uncharacterized protein n=1 Tax=Naganishia friedmannii TaxID=89922 RepID=A0ACC2V0M5_9TREE|nr:hypothetical protein QFC21_006793 [Naganishia friedmannii]